MVRYKQTNGNFWEKKQQRISNYISNIFLHTKIGTFSQTENKPDWHRYSIHIHIHILVGFHSTNTCLWFLHFKCIRPNEITQEEAGKKMTDMRQTQTIFVKRERSF